MELEEIQLIPPFVVEKIYPPRSHTQAVVAEANQTPEIVDDPAEVWPAVNFAPLPRTTSWLGPVAMIVRPPLVVPEMLVSGFPLEK